MHQFKVSFIIYADFEAILHSLEEETDPDPLSCYTRDINDHFPLDSVLILSLHMER